jgi:branched-chain amino acid transport system substrate-binding protein
MGGDVFRAVVIMSALVGTGMLAQTVVAPYASIVADGERSVGPGGAVANDLSGPVVRIGMLAPLGGVKKAEGDAMVAAARMALRDAGDRLADGRPIELATEDENGPSWGAISDAVVRLVVDDGAVVVIAPTRGADAHVCEQVGNRMGVPVLTLAADATTTQIDIPWIFRMRASDDVEAEALAQDIYSSHRLRRALLVTEADHDGTRGVAAMARAAKALGVAAPGELMLDPLFVDVGMVVKKIEEASPEAVVIWTAPSTAGVLMRALAAAGIKAIFYLSQDAAASDVGGLAAWTVVAEGRDVGFAQSFAERYQRAARVDPSVEARETYDAVTITVRALQAAGANRARVRDVLARVQNFSGASGRVSFDREGNDRVVLRVVRVAAR